MKSIWTSQYSERLFLLLVLCVALFLFLANLGNQYLWQDEAQTALISKTILNHGIPLGCDGRNYFSQDLGAEYGKNYVWKWHPWFPFYLLALFFKLFGFSTFAARLPFALFGIATTFLSYYLCKELWKDTRTAALAAILLLLSVPFLLLSRQCRYYAPAAFFSLLGLYGYVGVIGNRKSSIAILAVSAVLLFHTQFVFCAALLGSVLLHSVIFYRNKFLKLLILSFVVALVSFPWVIWVYNVDYSKVHPQIFTVRAFCDSLWVYLRDIAKYVFSPLLLVILLIPIFKRWVKTPKSFSKGVPVWTNLLLLVFFIVISLVALSLLSYAAFFRNLVALIPVFTLITAFLLMFLVNANRIAGIVVTIILVAVSPIFDYLYEITHDYDSPIEGIVQYLNKNGSKDDIVAITYGDMPLKFYTDMRIVGGLTGEDLSLAKQAKWVIVRKYVICEKDAKVREYLLRNLSWYNYRKIVINYPDIPFENREELATHYFRTATDEDRVVIFHKIR